jgi:glutamyl-tRNA(Gln) amidotransferase subunit E
MKCGLEIHQRINTKKLFCSCPSILAEDVPPDSTITRRLHPVLSELGEIDKASKAEFLKGKTFSYNLFNKSNCLVETDEEPPHELNPEALAIVLQIAAQLKATPVDEMHIMRKLVIDGSNTSGFQRTAIVAQKGVLETSKGPIGISLLALEEESAGIVEQSELKSTYRLDRLGIPLVEITTDPDIKDGEHLLEAATKIGLILRATGKVARGLGTIRQDVNISTEKGARVEIKGAQDLKMLPQIVDYEVMRQKRLVEIIEELKKRLGNKWKIKTEPMDVGNIFQNTQSLMISKGLKSGQSVYGLLLPKHAGILGIELQPNRRYGSELSDYAKSAGVKGIIHSDEDLAKYKISEAERKSIERTLGANAADAYALVIAPSVISIPALQNVLLRANMHSVPKETRKAHPNGTSSYMRPLPGRARMYPETDTPPIRITKQMIGKAASMESLEDKEARLSKILNPEFTKKMLKSRNLPLFEKLVKQGADPMLVANTLENTLVSLKREGIVIADLESVLEELFAMFKKGRFVKSAIPDILKDVSIGNSIEAAAKHHSIITGQALETIAKKENYVIRSIMSKFRTRIDPKELQEIIKKRK